MKTKKIDSGIFTKSSGYVTQLFKDKLPGWAVYHSLEHTIQTVEGCIEIGIESKVTNDELELLTIAAWFHDTGHINNCEEHEEISKEIASEFLSKNDYPSEKISIITDCIIATKITNEPANLLEKIICDADLISLGREDYFKTNELLKLEIEKREGIKISEYDWLKRSVEFLSSHNYYTEYAIINLSPVVEKNIKSQKQNLHELNMVRHSSGK